MKNLFITTVLLWTILAFSFDAGTIPPLTSGTYKIYYTFSVPDDVISVIQAAMNEVSPRKFIKSENATGFVNENGIEADPLNNTFNPDTLTYTGSFPNIYRQNGRINIHWGKTTDPAALGLTDPNLTPHDIVIDSVKYKDNDYDLTTILKHEILHVIGLNHTTATFDGNPASEKLMYAALSANTVKYMTQDEINGLNDIYNRHYFIPPTPEQVNGDPIFVVVNDSVNFMAKRNITLKDTLNADSKLLHPYDIDYYSDEGSQITFIDSVKMRTDSVLYKWFSGTSLGIKTIKTFIAGDQRKTRWLNRMKVFEIAPWVDIQHTQEKADTYSLENVNHFEAVCTDALGNDYPYMDTVDGPMKFYYKEAGTNDEYTLIPSDPPVKSKATTAYSCTWNSGTLKGEYIVKATAFYKESAESTEVLNWSASLTIRLLDGFECDITEPKPYDVEAVDFEKYMQIGGRLYHDGTVNAGSFDNLYFIYDMQNNGVSVKTTDYSLNMSCHQYKYNWYAFPLFDASLVSKVNKSSIGYLLSEPADLKDIATKSKSTVFSDSIKWYVPYRNDTIYASYDFTSRTKPGLYKLEGELFNSATSQYLANRDTVTYIRPAWKTKLHADFWHGYYTAFGVPYVEKTVYAPEERIKFYQWRPFTDKVIGTTNFNISCEGVNIANLITVPGDYEQKIVTKKKPSLMYGEVDVIDTSYVSTLNPAEWVRTGTEEQGLYQVTATEYDPETGCNVIQKKEIQIPPLYVTAETDNGWPVSVWPRGAEYEDMTNAGNWIVDTHNFNFATGSKTLAMYCRTDEKKGKIELSHPGVTITKDYNVEFGFVIGLKKSLVTGTTQTYAFDELIADYSIALDIDGTEEIIKTPTVAEWNIYDALNQWNNGGNDSIHYAVRFEKPLGSRVHKGSNVKVKLIINDANCTPNDTTTQTVILDEIRLSYTRKECPEGPAMPTGYYKNAKGTDCVEISFSAPQNMTVTPTGYVIYRDGVKIGETATTSYIDLNIESNRTYRYSITAAYNGLDYPESSMLDCTFSVTTGQITNPRPRGFTLTKGGPGDFNSAYLNWEKPLGDSLTVYNVYRNDLIIAQTDTTQYSDLWLADGDYYYYVTVSYPDGAESDPTEQKQITITTIQDVLPLLENFENSGISPEKWNSGSTAIYSMSNPEGRWKYGTQNPRGTPSLDGSFCAYIGSGPVHETGTGNDSRTDDITSPVLDLTKYKNVTISFNYMYDGDAEAYTRDHHLHIASQKTGVPDTTTTGATYWQWISNINCEYLYDYPVVASMFNSGWHTLSFPINDDILSDKTVFGIIATTDNSTSRKVYCYLMIDSLLITGTVKAEMPVNLSISNNNGAMNLAWDVVPDASMYYIYRSTKPDIGYQEIGSSSTTAFTDNITSIDDGVYFYKIVSEVTQKIYDSSGGGIIRQNVRAKEVIK